MRTLKKQPKRSVKKDIEMECDCTGCRLNNLEKQIDDVYKLLKQISKTR